jgi:hypothetical protein
MLRLERSFVNLDTSENRLKIPWKLWNMALEKDREDQLDQSCRKWGINESQGSKEHLTYDKTKEG